MRDDLTATVVICAFTEERWDLLRRAVASIVDQTLLPLELVICIDHNVSLYKRVSSWVNQTYTGGPLSIRVIQNAYPGRLGSARNSAVEIAIGEIVVFLDDDARAERNWLETILGVFLDEPSVVVVGGRPIADYAAPPPGWFPDEFNWVFGCHYRGMPEKRGTVRHLIGASMAARTAVLREIDGFHSDNHDDMDLSHRSRRARPGSKVTYEPTAIVYHHVGPERLSWSYFWRRCFHVNVGKVRALADMGSVGNLQAEGLYGLRVLGLGVPRHLAAVSRGDLWGPVRAAAIVAGLALGASGTLVGKIRLHSRPQKAMLTQGLVATASGCLKPALLPECSPTYKEDILCRGR